MTGPDTPSVHQPPLDFQGVITIGTAPDGTDARLIRIENGGTTAHIMTWGARLQDLRRAGLPHSMVLGSREFEPYLKDMRYFGAIVGPVANRIANGRFEINGQIVELEKNENSITTLHGGSTGTGVLNWQLNGYDDASCSLSVLHPDGASGFPGNIVIKARYHLDDNGMLELNIHAVTDAPTFCNLAHHSYWNLDGTVNLDSHRLQISAGKYLPVDDRLIPKGDPATVAGSRFDYLRPAPITAASGLILDHNFCLDQAGPGLHSACSLTAGGVRLDVETTEPGLQVYEGSGLNTGRWNGHGGIPYGANAGVALEPQIWPDAPNRPDFPPALLLPGEEYRQTTRFHLRQAG